MHRRRRSTENKRQILFFGSGSLSLLALLLNIVVTPRKRSKKKLPTLRPCSCCVQIFSSWSGGEIWSEPLQGVMGFAKKKLRPASQSEPGSVSLQCRVFANQMDQVLRSISHYFPLIFLIFYFEKKILKGSFFCSA
jgi:hypothetical protein